MSVAAISLNSKSCMVISSRNGSKITEINTSSFVVTSECR